MCGIVGYIGRQDALEIIISGLEKLEYRGYDSAGVAIIEDGAIVVTRAQGKLIELKKALAKKPRKSSTFLGIGHTRWATHGKPSETNAHPHTAGRISLIHNGIIENYIELRERLIKTGSVFHSETDTEIAAHLLNYHVSQGLTPFEALKRTCSEIRGSYAFLAIDAQHPDRILVAKNATPIVIGFGDGEMVIASDIPAILGITRRTLILEDGDLAEVTVNGVHLENGGQVIERPVTTISWDPITAQKGGFKHYMLKEIHEQATVIGETFRGRLEFEKGEVFLPELNLDSQAVQNLRRIELVACGTAWHACLVTKFYIEELAGIPCEVDYASEFRYRRPLLDRNSLGVVVSQSGETADTLAALNLAAEFSSTLAICNVVGSSIARKAGNVLYTHAGPEISVASTKAFTTQLIAGFLLAVFLGQKRGVLKTAAVKNELNRLVHLPRCIEEALKCEAQIEQVARKYHTARDFLFLGRGICYPIALEGALKLKEISYLHAEGYPAGEMKHGPIALIDENLPVVVVAQKSEKTFEKALSNLREVESRGGKIIVVTDIEGNNELHNVAHDVIEVPFHSEYMSPLLLTIPLQLLAYFIAVFNGTDVDLPRNLAKSVTVE